LDEPTQSRTRETEFHTGDVWKVVLCLKHYRLDLDIFTIPAAPAGLTVVTGLDPTSLVLKGKYDEAVARFVDAPFSAVEGVLETELNLVPNDWVFCPNVPQGAEHNLMWKSSLRAVTISTSIRREPESHSMGFM
jgi:hypothetical protein